MAKRKNPALAAAKFTGSAFRELSDLKRGLQSAEASLAHLNRALHVPVIRTPRTRTARTKSQPSFLLSLAGLAADSAFIDSFAGTISGFPQSSTQLAGKLFDAALRGQRLR